MLLCATTVIFAIQSAGTLKLTTALILFPMACFSNEKSAVALIFNLSNNI